MNPNPPRIPRFLLCLFRDKIDHESLIGDYDEMFRIQYSNDGPIRAKMWYWLQVLKAIPSFIINSIYWRFVMFENYLKIAFRNIKKHKGYSFINISGLAVGFACSILIALFVLYELSYDRFHEKADRIYRIVKHNDVSTPPPLASTLARDYPEVEYATSFANLRIQPVKYKGNVFYESPVLGGTHDCFNIFSFKFINGDRRNALKEPNTVVVTQSMAVKYFGSEDPIHKSITIGDEDYRIDGVIEDIPENSHFDFKFLVSNNSFRWYNQEMWKNFFMYTFILLRDKSDAQFMESKLTDVITKYIYNDNPNHDFRFYMQPLTWIHLNSALRFELKQNSDIKNIIMFSTTAIFIILIACINFMNLPTAKSMIRIKEIGIRKTVGSTRKQLLHQFLGESIFTSVLALFLGVFLVLLLLPGFNNIIGRQIGFQGLNLPTVIIGLVAFAVVVGMIAGVYPAFYLSSFRPVNVIKGMTVTGRKSSGFRNGLVVFQFVISIALIIGTITVYRQLYFIQNTNLGFDKKQVLIMKNLQPDPVKSETLKQQLMQHPGIVAVSSSANLPGKGNGGNYIETETGDTLHLNMYFCDFDFQETLQLEMAEGRFFSKEFSTDSAGIILNEHAVQANNIKNPIGQRMTFYYGRPIPVTVIGVVKDFHFQSLHHRIRSLGMVYGIDKGWGINYISIRLKTDDIRTVIQYIENTWKAVNPALPFDYSFLDEDYDRLYANEFQMGKLGLVFCILAIAVSCLGLLGLASFMAERRTKEIGIRKVLGASISGVFLLISKDLTKWALFANLIAWPIAYILLTHWLQNFAYRISIGWWSFVLAGMLTVGIALLTVSYQSIKAATANPVNALKYE